MLYVSNALELCDVGVGSSAHISAHTSLPRAQAQEALRNHLLMVHGASFSFFT